MQVETSEREGLKMACCAGLETAEDELKTFDML